MSESKNLYVPSIWNSFVAASPYGDVLQTYEWGNVKKPNWLPLEISIEKNNALIATALILKQKMLYSDRNFFYISRGPILDWNDSALVSKLFEKIRVEAECHNAAFITIDPAIPANDKSAKGALLTLRNLGFISSSDTKNSFGGVQPRYVMKLDISASVDEIMVSFHQKCRYNIRLGIKKGLLVQSDCTRDDLKLFHEIYLITAKRESFKAYSLAYFQNMWDELIEKNLAKLFLVRHENKVLAGAILFILPPQCWYVFGASSNEDRNLMPNHVMQWAMIQWAKENHCTTYDLRGVHDVRQDPNFDGNLQHALSTSRDGLVRFKAGFGAKLVEYIGEYDWVLYKT